MKSSLLWESDEVGDDRALKEPGHHVPSVLRRQPLNILFLDFTALVEPVEVETQQYCTEATDCDILNIQPQNIYE